MAAAFRNNFMDCEIAAQSVWKIIHVENFDRENARKNSDIINLVPCHLQFVSKAVDPSPKTGERGQQLARNFHFLKHSERLRCITVDLINLEHVFDIQILSTA